MLWSNGAYLPAHDNGQKYLSTAKELQDLMAGRLSSHGPFPVMTIDKAVKLKGMDQGIYDRYSQQEKSFGCVASNNSYSSANPSRIGAFEIHMVQGFWDPKFLVESLTFLFDRARETPPTSYTSGFPGVCMSFAFGPF